MFSFRLRFHLRGGDTIDIAAEEVLLHITPNGAMIKLKSGRHGSPIRENSRAAIVGTPYSTADQAKAAALECRKALLAWAVIERLGIDLGDDKLRSLFTIQGLRVLEEELGRPVRNDVHGVDVYESEEKTVFASCEVDAKLAKGGEAFVHGFGAFLHHPPALTDKMALSAELYALSFFEASFRARFLTLVTAMEALLEPAQRDNTVCEFVIATQERVRSLPLDDGTRQALQSSLEWLKRESIGQAGRALADLYLPDREYMSQPASRFFTNCYNVRSQMVHAGKPSNPTIDLLVLANAASQFIGDLLNAMIAPIERQPG
jgi:hypothetical protein